MSESGRSLVLVLGSQPFDANEFVRRHLTPKIVRLEELTDDLLNQSRGVFLSEFPGKYRVASEYFSGPFRRTCEFGLITVMVSSEQMDRDYFIKLRDVVYKDLDPVGVDPAIPWAQCDEAVHSAAEKLARHRAGPQLGKVEINTLDPKFKPDPATEALLKRAFWDCDKIVVEQLRGGKTAKETFRVFASISGPLYGPQPLPFFVKIGTPASIEQEKQHYRRRAEPFIPFYLRPALNARRCVTAFASAALVCDFVGSAVPLRVAWRNAQGAGTIFALFEVTLRGLRGHTARAPKEAGNIKAFLDERVKAGQIATELHGPARIARAKELGLTQTPEAVVQILLTRAGSIESRRGTYHGDLHCGNVMVRNQDAIVIDFGSMQDFGPITADPAFLEVSLVFGTDENDDPETFEDWQDLVDELFIKPLRPPIHDAEHFRFAWLRKAVRELRHVGSCCEVEPDEALIVLAGCLLRYGRLSILEFPKRPDLVKLSEDRRAYALVVAERICSKLSSADAKG